eukprot:CCRYP_017187-RA/>CCRYP_017187-RA protein AED:0.57 eAED:0.38 QI:0/0/0/1/0/0/2/0/142
MLLLTYINFNRTFNHTASNPGLLIERDSQAFRRQQHIHVNSIRNFDRTLIAVDATGNDDVWVAVYRSNNNLPNVFVSDEFFDAMKALMTVQEGRKGFAIYHSCFATLVAGTGFCINGGREIRQALGSCSIDQVCRQSQHFQL